MPTSGTFFIETSGVFWWGNFRGIMNATTKFNIGIYFHFCGLNGWANRAASQLSISGTGEQCAKVLNLENMSPVWAWA
jgi:hypothetical protein